MKKIAILLLFSSFHCAQPSGLKHLGTEYGGWTIPVETLNEDSICYCVGAGEDISFDMELINLFNCCVYCFDPTPKAITHLYEVQSGFATGKDVPINHKDEYYVLDNPEHIQKLQFLPYGLWDKNETVNLYLPQNPEHASYSAINLQKTSNYVPAVCKTLATFMDELGHTYIDLLKLDIEGAEYAVIEDMLAQKIFPTILCIEFHPTKNYNFNESVNSLLQVGYQLTHQHGNDLTFNYTRKP